LLGEGDDAKEVSEKISHFGGIVQMLNRNHDLLYCLNKVGLGKKGIRENILGEKKYNIILTPGNTSTPDDAHRIVKFAKEHNVNREKLDIFVFTSTKWERDKVEKITQAKEGTERTYPYAFHIVNEGDLLIRQMIQKRPPFTCPGLQISNGMAARDFTVMICGFGTMGQSALLHLIMNGQFVGSHMRAIIVDRNINKLRDRFLHRYPDLHLCCKMEFMDIDVQSYDFFKLLDENNNLDYVVITLHHNEVNKDIALNIQSHYEHRDASAVPCIAIFEKTGSLHEEEKDDNIFTFGCREKIYKESVLIRDETNCMAKAVHETYGGQPPWHELDWFTQESNRAVADFIPAMLMLADITEEDATGRDTLTEDSTLVEILAQTEKIRWNAFHAAMGYRSISIEEMQRRFEIYDGERNSPGCLDFSRKDSNARLHVCLAPWNQMDEISAAYRELAHRAGIAKDESRDFRNNDREIVKYIPLFLKAAKNKNQ
jgi:hypothetical protein